MAAESDAEEKCRSVAVAVEERWLIVAVSGEHQTTAEGLAVAVEE